MLDPDATVVDCDPANWNRVLAVNLGGAFLMSKFAIPHLDRAGGGSIIHLASQLGSVGSPRRVAYCATKGALIQLAKAMAMDHAAQNIRVNTLSPGAVETDRLVFRFGSMQKAREAAGPKHLLAARSAGRDRGAAVPRERRRDDRRDLLSTAANAQ
jgi:NAD(P)-dependent dehydrogenase (short-subunit alcohol dehydrogenase family)